MKNRTKFIIPFLLLIVSSVQAQRFVITIDSLRDHFRRDSPIEVYDYYENKREFIFPEFDYKALYYDQEMKNYLMTWLDPVVWVDYMVFSYKKKIVQMFEYRLESKESFIRYYVENNLKLKYDSIRQDTSIVKIYFHQALEKKSQEEKELLLKGKEKILPPWTVLSLHSRIAYPESYKKIKELWYQQNKSMVVDKFERFSDLFKALLIMNDPEVQVKINQLVKEMLHTSKNGENKCLSILSSLGQVENAYAIKKLIEILPIQEEIAGLASMEGISYVPMDDFTYDKLKMIFRHYNLETSYFSYDVKQNRKNKTKIVEVAKQLIKELEEKERYWMENMPFDYVPQIVK